VNGIERRFAELKARGEKALVCFLTGGDPDLATTGRLVTAIADAGADIVEIGIPFSDPLADGPSIQASSFRALSAGATIGGVFEMVRTVRQSCDVPIVLMTYFNPVNAYGVARFADDAADAGADGVIVTDLPPEEATEWKAAADRVGLAAIFLLAPTSTKDRIRLGAKMGSGFIYCVSRTGVTGARSDVPVELGALVDSIRETTELPIAVGFGISNPEQARQVAGLADGVVVGSALVNVIAARAGCADLIEQACEFVRRLKAGVG